MQIIMRENKTSLLIITNLKLIFSMLVPAKQQTLKSCAARHSCYSLMEKSPANTIALAQACRPACCNAGQGNAEKDICWHNAQASGPYQSQHSDRRTDVRTVTMESCIFFRYISEIRNSDFRVRDIMRRYQDKRALLLRCWKFYLQISMIVHAASQQLKCRK